MEDKVSVIIPVYNVEKYIKKCVNSVINQNYKNLEIILVDDGSPDNCPFICDEYAKIDSRIVVIHKKNGGLSDARNFGIDAATGNYVVFIDSDDYIEINYISTLVDIKKKYLCDVSYVSLISEKSVKPMLPYNTAYTVVLDSDKIIQSVLRGSVSASGKLFNAKHIKNHKFKEGVYLEDLLNVFEIYSNVTRMAFNNSKLYHYVQHKDSIMHSNIDLQSFNIVYDYLIKHYDETNNNNLKAAIIYRLFLVYRKHVVALVSVNNIIDYKYISNKIKKYLAMYVLDVNNSLKSKIAVLLSVIGLFTAKIYVNLYNIFRSNY